ncbi:MAG: hypothetical protein ETSY1_13755, partial [Candidatus Entotheonella factor]
YAHDINYGYIAAYFRDAGNTPYTEHTWYTGVHRLLPAHAMTVSAAGVRTWPYWQAQNVPALPPASEAAYIEQLADLLHRAVVCRTRAAYPVGVHLSGGLDSSGVTALAARQTRQHSMACTAFSWSSPPEGQPEDDGRALVESVRQAEGLCCHYAPGTIADVAATRLRPLHLPARRFYPESQVRRLAQAQGIRVILSGWGGDELAAFNGRGYLADLWRQGHWRTLWRESAAYARMRGSRLDAILRSKGLYPHLPDRLFQWVTRSEPPSSLTQQFSRSEPVLWHPDFIAQLVEADPGPLERMRRERPGVRRNQRDLLAHGHLTTRTEWWATEAPECGIVYRYPMLDRRLAEFGLGLPPQLFFRDGWSRYILRQALEGIVPPQVQWNWNKMAAAHSAYFQTLEWEWRQQVLKPLVTDVLSSHEHFHCLNPAHVPVMVQRMRSNPQDGLPIVLPPALQAELMMNRPLAMDIQAWLYEWRES